MKNSLTALPSVTGDLQATIDRVRRSTRNLDVLTICDELQRRLVRPAVIEAMRDVNVLLDRPKLSRAEIQKNYRQRKKAKGK